MDRKALLFVLILCCTTFLSAQTYSPSDLSIKGKAPKGITIKDNALYIAFSGDNKVVKTSLDGKTTLLEITGLGTPFDVDCDAQGRIWVANRGAKNVKVFDADKNELKTISFDENVNGVAVRSNGLVYIATLLAVHVYDAEFNLKEKITKLSADKFREVRKVYFDQSDNMYIVDKNTGTLKISSYANESGQVDWMIKKENGKNVYNRLASMTSTSNGNLIISADEQVEMGIYRFGIDGIFKDNIGEKGTTGTFNAPYGLAVDSNDNLYIADSKNDAVIMWKASDITAPVVANLKLDNITRSTVDLSLLTDEPATVYWAMDDADGETPAVEAVKQGERFEVSEANTLVRKTLTVGSVSNQKIYLVLEDKSGNVSDVIATDVFSTGLPLALNYLFPLSKTADAVTMETVANDNGTVYWMITESAVTPSISDIENGTGAVAAAHVDNAKAGERTTFEIPGLTAKRYYVYAFLKSGSDNSAVLNGVIMPAGDAEKIYQRYFSLLVGENPDYSNAQVVARYQALRSGVTTARQKLASYQWEEGLEPFDLSSNNTSSSTELRDLLGNVLLPLALSYQLEGPAETPNADYHNPQVLQEIVGLYDYLEKRGFVTNSALEFSTSGPYLGLAGYFYANILMREELQRSGQWQVVSDNMKWATRMVTDNVEGLNDDNKIWGAAVEHNGSRSDGVRTIYHNRLMTLACLTDDELTREDDLEYLRRTLEQNLKLNSAWDGFMKPDFTGYHHYGVWGNAYNIDALHTSCQMAMLLKDTPYALSESAVDNLANSLLAFRQYSGKYDVSRGLCGRFPNQLNTLLGNMPAFAYLYEVLEGEMKDRIGGAFCRLYDPAYSGVMDNTVKDVKSDIYFHGGMQTVQLMNALKAKDLTDDEMSESNRTYPYAAMQVHRRGEWMAAVKGYSKYVWDFETNSGQNWLGRNQSAGGLSLYATKDTEGVVTGAASGLGYNGWDWVHVPGATVLNMSLDDIVKEAKAFEWAKFSPQYFSGGVSLEKKHGVYGMIYNDIRQAYDYDNGRKWLGVKLSANKSYFFFDDEIVALGSAINNTHADYDAHTTLFQNELASADTPLYVNGEAKTGLFVEETQTTNVPCYLTDAVGNGYVIPDAKGLTVKRSEQISMKDGNLSETKGNYAKAWLNHGKETNGSYDYLIYVGGADKVKAMSGTPVLPYTVQQQDEKAHVVYHAGKKLKGYALFQAVTDLNDNYIVAATKPCMAMIEETGEKNITISVSNPELGFYPEDKFPYQVWSIDADKRFLDSEEQPVEVTLKGEWTVDETNPKVERIGYDADKNETTLRFNGMDAESLEVRLSNQNTSGMCASPEAVSFTCYPNPFTDRLTLDFADNTDAVRQVALADVSGRIVYSAATGSAARLVIPTASLAQGVYILLINGQATGEKLIKR
ncbi:MULTISPECIES: chondroitinase family polysaccharide lyase [unclassified Bacteroides]|uniref:chondroitinase family polysaccharide lyase n=1 Tax=unclassified Bacteroides TaxID=2646097 RepID=UPI000EFFCFA5|nr:MULTISPECIES: chondroitinase family polysaccharide lyase [unclassified Bacteroides]